VAFFSPRVLLFESEKFFRRVSFFYFESEIFFVAFRFFYFESEIFFVAFRAGDFEKREIFNNTPANAIVTSSEVPP